MAVDKRHRLKLKHITRLRQLSEYTTAQTRNLKELMIMASAPPEQLTQSPLRSAPEPLSSSSFSFPNSSSLPSQRMLSHLPGSLNTPMTAQRRRNNKMAKHTVNALKRSASTPNVRAGETGLSVADKRRNKLGYHRTSVACGHCRRRKIRCLLAPDDAQNRCSNCIRLKKECNFFPVDQQPQVERRPRAGSKMDHGGETSISSSSSPAIGSSLDSIDHFNHYPPLPLSSHDYPSAPNSINGDVMSPVGRGPTSHRPFEFSHQPERSHWDSPFYDHGPLSAGHSTPEDPAQAYWKLADSPVTPSFPSQFTQPPSSVPQSARDPGPSFSSRDESGWPMHSRSMSFGHVDDVSLNYPSHYNSPLPMEFRRRASDMHPPSLQTSGGTSSNTSEARSTPLSAPPVPSQPMHHYSASPTWSAITGHQLLSKGSDYGSWYSDPAPALSKVQEEDLGHHFGGDSAILYAGGGHR